MATKDTHNAFASAINNGKKPATPSIPGATIAKFSLELDNETDITFEQLRLTIKRKVGKSVRKADVLRALIMLAADEPTIINQVVEELQNKN